MLAHHRARRVDRGLGLVPRMDDSPTVDNHLRPLPIADLSRRFARPILSVRLAVITISHTCCRCRDGETILVQWSWSALARSCELGNCLLLPCRRPALLITNNTVALERSSDHRDRSAYLRARELRRLRLDEEGRHLRSTAYRIPSKSFSKVQVINTNVISVSAVKMRAVFPHSALVALPACLAPTRRFSRCPAMSPQLRSCFW